MSITFVNHNWVDSIITRLSRDVSVLTSNKSIHPISGEETLTDNTSTTVSMVFYKSDQNWTFDKEGMVEGGDAFAVTSSATDLDKDDKVTDGSETFRVFDKIAYYSDNNNEIKLYTYYNLFLVK